MSATITDWTRINMYEERFNNQVGALVHMRELCDSGVIGRKSEADKSVHEYIAWLTHDNIERATVNIIFRGKRQ